jgi:hypothetical protein
MLMLLELLVESLCGRSAALPDPDPKPTRQCRWVIDLPPIGNIRLGAFRTRDECLDARREYIIRTLSENSTPQELPF